MRLQVVESGTGHGQGHGHAGTELTPDSRIWSPSLPHRQSFHLRLTVARFVRFCALREWYRRRKMVCWLLSGDTMTIPASHRPAREWFLLVLALLIVGGIVTPLWQFFG